MKFTTNLKAFSIVFYTTFFALLSQLVLSLPLTDKRDVFVPRIITPDASTVWHSGEIQTVTWDISDAPQNITNSIGFILLRAGEISTPVILADNFNILDAQVNLTVPNVLTRDDFSIVLFGDSGNFSPQFTIVGKF
ncbi:hypothetical protein NLI96_g11692 [Meripilus lineatus]|uniref:Uncharacterized protein n=1 Tax=Meripilus lineatus TaxID=2056292 RepID=A0AAD5USX0_9APHY|nr:hypothetical protein NLI96_g11692 [Physisporinus lineatus]